jgi:hypothetical protein
VSLPDSACVSRAGFGARRVVEFDLELLHQEKLAIAMTRWPAMFAAVNPSRGGRDACATEKNALATSGCIRHLEH